MKNADVKQTGETHRERNKETDKGNEAQTTKNHTQRIRDLHRKQKRTQGNMDETLTKQNPTKTY